MTGKNFVKVMGAMLIVLGLLALSGLCQEPKHADGSQYYVIQWEMKLRVLEGVKLGATPPPAVVTSSFLKHTFSANFQSDEDLAEEQVQIKRIFNLKEARLLTEGLLEWRLGKPEKVDYVFRLDGKEYLVRMRGGDLNAKPGSIASQSFGIEVFENLRTKAEGASIENQVSLLDTQFTFSSLKNVTVFGFEDSQGKPYFVSLRQTKMYADEAVLKHSGVAIGKIVSEVKPPKLINQVDPVYPEDAIRAGTAGIVIVEATTDVNGRVAAAKILKSVPGLDQAAIDAVKQWIYEPMMIDGKPRPVIMTVTLQFTLAKDKDGRMRGITGVEGGVLGGMYGKPVGWIDPRTLGGVQGGVSGGVEGGVEGGVVGGVVGSVVGGVLSQEQKEFEKGAVRAVGDIMPPRLVKAVDPVYPEIARQAQVEGVVIVEARADEKGNVEDARILRSIPLLDQAAIEAVKQWKYEPAIINGKPQKVVVTVTVRFMLKSGDKQKDLDRFAQGAVKAEGAIPPPKLIRSVDPVYPEIARQARVEGVVILAAKTDASGKIQDVMILRSIPLLNQAAIDAVRQWVYEPLVINNVPTPVVFTVTVRFQIPEKEKVKKSA